MNIFFMHIFIIHIKILYFILIIMKKLLIDNTFIYYAIYKFINLLQYNNNNHTNLNLFLNNQIIKKI